MLQPKSPFEYQQHKSRLSNSVSLYPLTALALAACGGGGGGGDSPITEPDPPPPPTPTETLTGRVYDGPIVGAQVYFDVNANGVQDDGDVQVATTDESGSFTISAEDLDTYGADTPLLAVLDGATDIGDDLDDPSDDTPASGTWQTPVGSSVISPLTDLLVRAEIDSARVAELVELPSNVDVTQYDPYDSDTFDATDLAVIAAGQEVAEVLAELDTTGAEVTVDEIIAAIEEAFDAPPTAFTLTSVVAELPEDTDTTERVKIADLVVTDADTASAEQAYSLSGDDAALFEVEGAELFLIAGASLDFERALELGGSSLDVTVAVDGTDLTQTHTLTLTNVDDNAPTDILFTIPATLTRPDGTIATVELAENSAPQKLADITFEDVDGGNNAVKIVGTSTIFELRTDPITGDTELWLQAGVLDYETNTIHTVTLDVATEGVNVPTLLQTFTLTVTDADEPPTAFALTNTVNSLAEDAGVQMLAVITFTDDALGTNGVTITGDNANLFEIRPGTPDASGKNRPELWLVGALDYEFFAASAEKTHTITLTATTNSELTQDFTLTVTDVDEPPIGIGFSPTTASVAEDTTATTKLADITFTDDALGAANNGARITEDLADLFVLRNNDTELWLKAGASLDFEAFATNEDKTHTVTLQATWNGAPVTGVTREFTLTVTDVNEAPVLTVVSPVSQEELLEGTVGAANIATGYTVRASDEDESDTVDTVTFTITRTGSDGSVVVDTRFAVVNNELVALAGSIFDFETEPSITLMITATDNDGTTPLTSAPREVTIQITNVPSAPVISVSGQQDLTLNEGTTRDDLTDTERQTGYTFTAADVEDGDTVTLSVNDDRFEIVDGKLLVKTGRVFDYEATTPNGEITLTITATDDSPEMRMTTQDVTITVMDVTSDPTITIGSNSQTLTLNEGTTDYSTLTGTAAPTGHTFTATDEDGNAATLSVEDDRFEIVIGSGVGVLRIKTGQVFDFETENPLTVVVVATDANGRVASTSVTIQITDMNEAPVLTVVSPVSQEELLEGTVGSANIATGYTVTAPDEDDGDTVDTVTFTITRTGTNVVDNRFAVENDKLVAVAGSVFDHETEETIRLTITASDGRLSSNTETVEIIITNDPSPPTISVSGSQMLTLNEGTTVYSETDNSDRETGFSFTAEDVEDGDTVTLSVNDDRFEIVDGKLLVKTGQIFDYEATAPNADGDPSGDLTVVIVATDSDGQVTEKSVTITITDVTFSTVLTDVGDFYDSFDFTPAFGHFDGDSVVDFLLGDADGFLNHFSWDGTDWSDQTFLVLPFPFPLNLNFGGTSAPAFGDVDGDGDDDLLVGEADGILNYLRWGEGDNTGTGWTVLTDDIQNPFNSINFGSFSAPTFGDVDGDGDDDLLVGNGDGFLTYYSWDGTLWLADEPNNPFDGINFGFDVKPTFGDVDGDGDDDLLVGEEDGMLTFYRWGGADDDTAATPATGWSDQTSEIPTALSGSVVYGWSAPAFGDVDGDGDDDLVVGGFSTLNIWYWNDDDTWSQTSDII